jgi:uncharacterized protein (DUF1697 family)
MSTTYVAFLRGINVGGKAMISMASLKETFQSLGLESVTTYINSGNVIFRAPAGAHRKLESGIERALDRSYHLPIRVVVRDIQEIADTLAHTPKSWRQPADKKCNVIFLHHHIDTPDITRHFQPKPDIEELQYYPGVLFWSADLRTLTRSNMIRLSASPLYAYMTIRIYNTVLSVYTLMQGLGKDYA